MKYPTSSMKSPPKSKWALDYYLMNASRAGSTAAEHSGG